MASRLSCSSSTTSTGCLPRSIPCPMACHGSLSPRFLCVAEALVDTIRDAAMTDSKRAGRSAPERGRAAEPGAALPARKPMARVTRIALIEREVREQLSLAALDLLFGRAEVISEGQ